MKTISFIMYLKSLKMIWLWMLMIINFMDWSVLASNTFALSFYKAQNQSLFWGTYRPSLYFGTRHRSPESILTGLMWFDIANLQGVNGMKKDFKGRR